jgi:hypothetical protein
MTGVELDELEAARETLTRALEAHGRASMASDVRELAQGGRP